MSTRSVEERECDPEASLIRRALAGDRKAFDAMARIYAPRITMDLLPRVANQRLAEDLAIDALAKAWEKIVSHRLRYQGVEAFRWWLVMVARNMAVTDVRKQKLRAQKAGAIPRPEDPVPPPPEEAELNEKVKHLWEAWEKANLSNKEKEVLSQRFYSKMKFREIADLLKIPEGTVKWLHTNAILKLRNYLTQKGHKGELE